MKHNTKKERKPCCVADIYPDLYTGKQHPVTPEFFERLACEFVTYFRDNKKAIIIDQFPFEKGIPRRTFQRWCKREPALKRVYDDVFGLIAARREVDMNFGIQKEKPNMHILHRYSKHWDAADKRWAELKNKEEIDKGKTTLKVVEIQSFKEKDDRKCRE